MLVTARFVLFPILLLASSEATALAAGGGKPGPATQCEKMQVATGPSCGQILRTIAREIADGKDDPYSKEGLSVAYDKCEAVLDKPCDDGKLRSYVRNQGREEMRRMEKKAPPLALTGQVSRATPEDATLAVESLPKSILPWTIGAITLAGIGSLVVGARRRGGRKVDHPQKQSVEATAGHSPDATPGHSSGGKSGHSSDGISRHSPDVTLEHSKRRKPGPSPVTIPGHSPGATSEHSPGTSLEHSSNATPKRVENELEVLGGNENSGARFR